MSRDTCREDAKMIADLAVDLSVKAHQWKVRALAAEEALRVMAGALYCGDSGRHPEGEDRHGLSGEAVPERPKASPEPSPDPVIKGLMEQPEQETA